MLLKAYTLMNPLLLAVAMASILSGSVYAQDTGTDIRVDLPYLDLNKINGASVSAAKESGSNMVKDILTSYETLKTQEMTDSAQHTKRKFDDIADEALSGERKKVLDFLGVDPEAETGLYFLVSWSMPLDLLRSYVIEAMWSGASLIFKGVPPGKELGKFIVNDLRELVYGKGAAVSVSIDPRIFDAYQISTVPAIVFTTQKENMQCQGVNPVEVKVGNEIATYDTCPPLDPDTYWKVTGGVTTSYALQEFINNGANSARPYLTALSKGFANGTLPKKEQQLFTGAWKDAISPSELIAAKEAAAAVLPTASAVEPVVK